MIRTSLQRFRDWLRDRSRTPASSRFGQMDDGMEDMESVTVDTPEGVPSSLKEARKEITEARLLGQFNNVHLQAQRTALEALVMELRRR